MLGSRFALALLLLTAAVPLRAQEVPVPIEAAVVGTAPIVDRIQAIGTLAAEQSIMVRSEVPGIVTRIHVGESSPVRRGQPLFSLDDSIARAELQQAEAALNLSQRNYERALELARSGAGTARARDEAQASLEANRALVALMRARLEKTVIQAPFDGTVGLKRVDVGAYITVGQDLVTLDAIDTVNVDFSVPERFLRFVSVGRALSIEADALPGRTFAGEINALSPRIDPDGRSLAVRGTAPNPDHALKPGMFVRVSVIVAQREHAIVVPEQAIIPQGDQIFVYRIVDDKAVRTPVKLGLRSFGRVEIVSGLSEGELIITAGQLKVQDGNAVRIVAQSRG